MASNIKIEIFVVELEKRFPGGRANCLTASGRALMQ